MEYSSSWPPFGGSQEGADAMVITFSDSPKGGLCADCDDAFCRCGDASAANKLED